MSCLHGDQERKPSANSCLRAQMSQADAAQRTLLAREARRAAGWPRAGTSLTSLHRRRRGALWMPDLERVALAKVMKDCGGITGTRITFMACGGGDAGEKRLFKES